MVRCYLIDKSFCISYCGPVEVVLDPAEEGTEGYEENCPDEDNPQLVQDSSGGSVQLLGHGHPRPVRDSNRAHEAQSPAQQPVVVLKRPTVALVTIEDHYEGK